LLAVDPVKFPEGELQPFDAISFEAGASVTVWPMGDVAWLLTAKIWNVERHAKLTSLAG